MVLSDIYYEINLMISPSSSPSKIVSTILKNLNFNVLIIAILVFMRLVEIKLCAKALQYDGNRSKYHYNILI
jgi:hypothetical protein